MRSDYSKRKNIKAFDLGARTLLVLGYGRIGTRVSRLASSFGMTVLVCDEKFDLGVSEVDGFEIIHDLDEGLARSTFLTVHIPLTDKSANLIDKDRLLKMPKGSYLVNCARGGIVDEESLFDALKNQQIAGAALDCFEDEPVTERHRFGELENVILAPHSIAWTAELFRDIGRTACQSMLDLSHGRRPAGVLNPELLDRPSYRAKWSRVTGVPERSLG